MHTLKKILWIISAWKRELIWIGLEPDWEDIQNLSSSISTLQKEVYNDYILKPTLQSLPKFHVWYGYISAHGYLNTQNSHFWAFVIQTLYLKFDPCLLFAKCYSMSHFITSVFTGAKKLFFIYGSNQIILSFSFNCYSVPFSLICENNSN